MVNPILTLLVQLFLVSSAGLILLAMIREGRSARQTSVGTTNPGSAPAYERHIVLMVRSPRRATVSTRRPGGRAIPARRGAA
jgi:hypothetical protein